MYNCDDAYFRHLASISPEQFPRLFRAGRASPEEVWLLRSVNQQIEDELALYREEFPLIVDDLAAMTSTPLIVAEGAALLPASLSKYGIPADRAIWMIPAETFQREHYAQRPWRHDVVKDCSDPDRAWENWMSRDAGFAIAVEAEARRFSLKVLITDGTRSIEETVRFVEKHFGL